MKQRAITDIQIRLALKHPKYTRKLADGRKEAISEVDSRQIRIIFTEQEKYIKIITIM